MATDANSLFAPLLVAAQRSGLTDFVRWWRDELVAMLPVRWRERLSSRDTAYLCAEGDEWLALRPVAGRLAQAGRVNLGSLDFAGRRAAFRRLLSEEPGTAGNVWLLLPRQSVLIREVHLPLAAEEALRDAIGFDLDRLTPLPADRAWFDYRIIDRDTAAQRLTLTLAATARAPVATQLAELRELGATVLGVGVMNDVASALIPLNLLPPEERDRPATSGATIASRLLAVAAAVLAVAAMIYPLWLKREAVIALYPRLHAAMAGAEVAERVAKEIDKLASEHNFVLAKKQSQQPAVALLEELSRLLPDTTWVQQLDMKTNAKLREVQIAGETGSSSQLIEVLERSGSFANAGFKSPLTKGVSPNTERFLLAAEVKPRPLPEPVSDAELAVPPPRASPEQPAESPSGSKASASSDKTPAAAPPLATVTPSKPGAADQPVSAPQGRPVPGRPGANPALPPVADPLPAKGTGLAPPAGNPGAPHSTRAPADGANPGSATAPVPVQGKGG